MSGRGGFVPGLALSVLFILLLIAAVCGLQSEKADARASIAKYLTTQPNNWDPVSYNIIGTAVNATVATVGWNATKITGNVGLGDGSLAALRLTSNPGVNFSENDYMAGDISEEPWNPSRILREAAPEAKDISKEASAEDSSTSGVKEASEPEEKNAGPETPVITPGMALNDPFHAILFGRPVDDLYYEDPLTISGTAYLRLLGLPMPGGGCLNIGMRTLGYGY